MMFRMPRHYELAGRVEKLPDGSVRYIRSSGWELLTWLVVTALVLGAVYYLFAVVIPRLRARRCPQCRTIMAREETDRWQDEARGTWSFSRAVLVRYRCSCGYEDERWEKRWVPPRSLTDPGPISTTETEQRFLGQTPPEVLGWLEYARRRHAGYDAPHPPGAGGPGTGGPSADGPGANVPRARPGRLPPAPREQRREPGTEDRD